MPDLPDWITVNGKVAVRIYGYTGRAIRFDIRTVQRLTATQIVLSDGRRFRRSNLNAVGSQDADLLSPSDPRVLDGLAKEQVERLHLKLNGLLKDFDGDAEAAIALHERLAEVITTSRARLLRKD